MKKVIVFGTGKHYEYWKEFIPKYYEIIAFADNNDKKRVLILKEKK